LYIYVGEYRFLLFQNDKAGLHFLHFQGIKVLGFIRIPAFTRCGFLEDDFMRECR
jgi:hypothetical protein